MSLWKNFITDVFKRPSFYFFIFFIIFSIDRHERYETSLDKNFGPFESDVYEYYSYLPEYFYDFKHLKEVNFVSNKRTIGMAIMYSPAFLVGHCLAEISGDAKNGYSAPYQKSIRWLSIIYLFIGLIFCRKNLLFFFKEPVVFISLACIFYGTNLFNYTYASGEFPHAYLFFLNSIFIYSCLKWIKEIRPKYLLLLSFIAGFVVLIRPTGIVILLFPLIFDVKSRTELLFRIKFIFRHKIIFLLSTVLFLVPFLLQMIFWKIHHGQYLYYSYTHTRFFFNDPQVINFLFSYRKGWLIYTPIMVFSLLGMLLSRARLREFYVFSILFFTLNIYLLSCWCDWAFGGSFGCRALIEFYAFFIFPFAVFVDTCWNLTVATDFVQKTIRSVLLITFYLLIEINLFQTWQYKYGRIHWDGMTKEAYRLVFLREVSAEEMPYVKQFFKSPDYDKMLKGDRDE